LQAELFPDPIPPQIPNIFSLVVVVVIVVLSSVVVNMPRWVPVVRYKKCGWWCDERGAEGKFPGEDTIQESAFLCRISTVWRARMKFIVAKWTEG
jgi:hypothetical protein